MCSYFLVSCYNVHASEKEFVNKFCFCFFHSIYLDALSV